jgi:hypothetical protein
MVSTFRLRGSVRMTAGLLVRDRTIGDQLLHVAVVLRQLHQLVVPPQIDAAVADPGDFEAIAIDACGHDRRAHGQCIVTAA